MRSNIYVITKETATNPMIAAIFPADYFQETRLVLSPSWTE